MISLDQCNRSCKTVDDLSTKMRVLNKTKSLNVEVFNTTTRIYEAKALIKHISSDCKCKVNSTTYNSNQKQNYETCQCKYKTNQTWVKDYSWNPSTF